MIRCILIIILLFIITITTTSLPSKHVVSHIEDRPIIKQVISEANNNSTTTTTTTTITLTTTIDPNADPDDTYQTTQSTDKVNITGNNNNNDKNNNNGNKITTQTKPNDTNKFNEPNSINPNDVYDNRSASTELGVFIYSVFIVYVSFIKLFYHNVRFIRRFLTEPGILIISGIIWELIAKQINLGYDVFPRFNHRIFFYLFLPSTILESASLLSNKWLFFNLLPILLHSIVGTLLFASSLGFTIFFLCEQNVFNLSVMSQTTNSNFPLADNISTPTPTTTETTSQAQSEANTSSTILGRQEIQLDIQPQVMNYATSGSTMMQFHNLTLSDCLIFSTVISSIDSTIMLNMLKSHQVNEKLYYLVLGENLMNNAVVLVLFELLLAFFNTTRLTVVRVYITIIQFFTTLIGSVFIGLILAIIALVSVRLTKRFQIVPSALTSYQNQCQAMVETLLILKLAYMTYNLASLASTSSILSLVTFGIFEDQYIKQNLNLRSQLTYRQVILATKTMGYSLVYPLIGMLLVEVANTGQFFLAWLPFEPAVYSGNINLNDSIKSSTAISADMAGVGGGANSIESINGIIISANSIASSKLSILANEANLHWNFKFLSIVAILTIVYRFVIVILLASVGNLLSGGQLKIRFREQILMAYGGLKGPIAIALVQKLFEHQEYKDKTVRNKHLFTYTVLFIIFMSTVITGSMTGPIVAKIQSSLFKQTSGASGGGDDDELDIEGNGQAISNVEDKNYLASGSNINNNRRKLQSIVFDEINYKLSEHVTRGINSILGHHRSSYDRFIEFNETHIKPRLTRKGCNTNWLSVFYDNLILNETLNANHFYLPNEDLSAPAHTTTRINNSRRLRDNRIGGSPDTNSRRRRSSIIQLPLDTIDEHSMIATGRPTFNNGSIEQFFDRPTLGGEEARDDLWHIPDKNSSMTTATFSRDRRNPNKYRNIKPPNSNGLPETSLLREYVMLDLRLEEEERQRKLAKRANYYPTTSSGNENAERMLSTTSDDGEPISTLEGRPKQRVNLAKPINQDELQPIQHQSSHSPEAETTSSLAINPRDGNTRRRHRRDKRGGKAINKRHLNVRRGQ